MGFPKILLFVWPCSFDSKLPGTLAAQHILGRTGIAVDHSGSFHHKDSVLTQAMPKICQHPFLIRCPQQNDIQICPKNCSKGSLLLSHLQLDGGIAASAGGRGALTPFLAVWADPEILSTELDPVGCSGEHPTDGCAAPATSWWAQESILQTDTLLFPRQLPCIAPPA